MSVLIGIAVVAIIMPIVMELTHWQVFGGLLKEQELDAYLTKYLPFAKLNPFSQDATLLCDMPKYVARSQSVLTKWHIEGYGCVPRWSKWSKRLDEKRRVLMSERPKPLKTPLSLL